MNTKGLCCTVLVVSTTTGRAQFWAEQVIPPPVDVTSTGQFGWSLSLEGDYLLVGAPGSDDGGPNRGAAFIFKRNEGGTNDWDLLTRLAAPNLSNNARFGTTVALHDQRAFVCAPSDQVGGEPCGAVYIFERDQDGDDDWGFKQRLSAPVPEVDQAFGSSITFANDTVVIGATGMAPTEGMNEEGGFITYVVDESGSAVEADIWRLERTGGSCQLFKGWLVCSKFTSSNSGYRYDSGDVPASANDQESDELKLDWPGGQSPWGAPNLDNIILAGPAMSSSGQFAAIATIETVSILDQGTQELIPATIPLIGLVGTDGSGDLRLVGFAETPVTLDPAADFGHSVALNTRDLAVGAPGVVTGSPVGSVFVFSIDTIDLVLEQRTVLYPTDPAFGDLFGWSIAAQDGLIAVGAPDRGDDDAGQVHLFFDPTAGVPVRDQRGSAPIRISPNPAASIIDVRAPVEVGRNATLEVLDPSGRIALRILYRMSPQRIDVGALAPGHYTLRLSRDGRGSASAQLIINR